ncbi:MAG: NTP transferase domain-containing protein [Gammaproteobacteria bacterium]|nr:NTP transferase domain-containing protein [Gammaproteobacteria bacterium]MDH3768056.1 NTP transferase domain-containing protein [Gammaproteobacteria bacterium]
MNRTLHGLVLAGGNSERMQSDKALLNYHGQPQLQWAYDLIDKLCDHTYISVRSDQHDEIRDALPRIEDTVDNLGPGAGLLAAAAMAPDAAWLAIACDLPFITPQTINNLIDERDPSSMATAYRSANDRLPEPLCTIWEPTGLAYLREMVDQGIVCPRKILIRGDTHLLNPISASALENINTPAGHADAMGILGPR